MRPTRRWGLLAGAACFFAVFAVVLGAPTPFFAAGGLVAWLVIAQVNAVRTMQTVDGSLAASTTISDTSVSVGDRAAVTVTASLPTPLEAPIEIELVAPPSVSGPERTQRTVTIEPGERSGSTTASVTFPIAGRIAFETLRVTVEDQHGYFTETITIDVDATCLVSAPSPGDIHVGQGGRSVGTMFGSHSTDQTGPGLVPYQTREYVTGDTLAQVDWKTTARMNDLYIREFESESDYLLSLVVDAGAGMNVGPDGRTKHAYAREIALSCLHAAESYSDPVAARLVVDDGTAWALGPSASTDAYRQIRQQLLDSDPRAGVDRSVDPGQPVGQPEARTRRQRLDDDSPFATVLRPFFAETATYVSRVSDRPLFDAVKTACGDADRQHHLVLVTDDSAKVETYEAAALAAEQSRRTSVFLTPTVLFESAGRASDNFVEFEEFRKRLDHLPNVTAYEIAPRDAVERATTELAAVAGEP
ncbi:DUF58 domain-containing protein [Halobellus ordinarius]|uniref:DUF58 domain-containing protein n=1 Tax=Halobellus ordinarius TaxID=3075120 RepID=UPI002880486B|nr:DUF58 domain-containing protein [Halobellus sp. ZY16]